MRLVIVKIIMALLFCVFIGSIQVRAKGIDVSLLSTCVFEAISIIKQNEEQSVNQDVVQFKDNPFFLTSKGCAFDGGILDFSYTTCLILSHYQLDTMREEIPINEILSPASSHIKQTITYYILNNK